MDELARIKTEQIASKRVAAIRARRLAGEFWSAADRERALRFAEELDAQADELERFVVGKAADADANKDKAGEDKSQAKGEDA